MLLSSTLLSLLHVMTTKLLRWLYQAGVAWKLCRKRGLLWKASALWAVQRKIMYTMLSFMHCNHHMQLCNIGSRPETLEIRHKLAAPFPPLFDRTVLSAVMWVMRCCTLPCVQLSVSGTRLQKSLKRRSRRLRSQARAMTGQL